MLAKALKSSNPKRTTGPKSESPFSILSADVYVPAMLVGMLGFLLYANTIQNGYALDDKFTITQNYLVQQGVEGIPTLLRTSYRHGYWTYEHGLYRPLSLVMFALEWQFAPGVAALGHFVNALLYAVTAFLLFLVLRRLLFSYHVLAPFLISILFTVHPIHTEVIANIKSRDEIMAFLLIVLSLHGLMNSITRSSKSWLVFALCAYFLALLSKESAITFLAIVPATLYFFSQIRLNRLLLISAGFLLPAALYLCLRIAVLGSISATESVDAINNLLVAAPGLMSRWATAFMIMGKYLGLLVVPHPLVIDYSLDQITITTWRNPLSILSLALYLAMIVIVCLRIRRKEPWVYGILFFLLTFTIYTNLVVLIGWHLGERFLYAPSLGFCITVGFAAMKLLKIPIESEENETSVWEMFVRHRGVTVLLAFVLLASGFKVVSRNAEWKNDLTLFSADVEKAPKSARMHFYYGLELLNVKVTASRSQDERNKVLDESISHLNLSASIYPRHALTWSQLGLASFHKQDLEGAIAHYQKALELSPGLPLTHNNLGLVYVQQGKLEAAMQHFKNATKLDPLFVPAHINLGHTYIDLGRRDQGIQSYLNGLEYQPNNVQIHDDLATAYREQGLIEKSEYHLNETRRLGLKQ